jgi:ElaB/YqjD/DUF883 family membrane-anchored ribosome-binding protein
MGIIMTKSTHSSKKAHAQYCDDVQSFKEEFSRLNEDLQAILQHVKKSGPNLAKDLGNDFLERAEHLASRMKDLNDTISGSSINFLKHQMERTKEKAQEYATDLEETIKEHPLSSVALSFGIGVLLAKVLGPWHSSR